MKYYLGSKHDRVPGTWGILEDISGGIFNFQTRIKTKRVLIDTNDSFDTISFAIDEMDKRNNDGTGIIWEVFGETTIEILRQYMDTVKLSRNRTENEYNRGRLDASGWQ